jgi:RNA polymerase sigma factor (sigma-70 family)
MAVGQHSTIVQQLRSLLLKQDVKGATDEYLLASFLDQRDEAAFEALVRRHGPMVLGVCRRILGSSHDAEDAFQATFLVLVRKAASIRPKSMVGHWLYGVACRTALDARRAAAKRKAKEAAVLPRTPRPTDGDRADLRAVLDEELQRLPPKCRAVIVLSDLEGKTRKEVAQQLGWPEGSVASRLARARARLAMRLARYGLAVSGVSVRTLLSEGVASAWVPNSLVAPTVKAASLLAPGQAAAGAIPAPVGTLVEGALKAMLLNRVLKATVLLLVLVTLGTGTGLLLSHAGRTERQEGKVIPADRPATEAKGKAKDEAKEDLDRMQGTWRVVSSQVGDEKAAEDKVKKRKVTVKGNVLTYDYGNEKDPKRVGTIKLDPKTKALDWTWTSPEAAPTMLAIYELKGNDLKIGFGNDGVVRPRRWVMGKDDVVWLLVLKREKP